MNIHVLQLNCEPISFDLSFPLKPIGYHYLTNDEYLNYGFVNCFCPIKIEQQPWF